MHIHVVLHVCMYAERLSIALMKVKFRMEICMKMIKKREKKEKESVKYIFMCVCIHMCVVLHVCMYAERLSIVPMKVKHLNVSKNK